MKIIVLFLLSIFISVTVYSQTIASKKEIISKMNLVNSFFATSKGNIKTDKNYSIYLQGLMALNSIRPNTTIPKQVINWLKSNPIKLNEADSFPSESDLAKAAVAIDYFNIEKLKSEPFTTAYTSTNNIVNSYKLDSWSNLNALYFLLPNLAKMGAIYKNEDYFDKLYQVFMYVKGVEELYSEQDFLWYYDASYKPPFKTPKGRNCFWARGNGQIAASLANVLESLSPDAPHYDEYLESYREIMIALLNLQREDGFWNISLADSENFAGKELTGTALITYAMAWGIRTKLIDADTFTPLVNKAINGMLAASIHKNGALGWVQGNGKEPKDGQPVTFDKLPDSPALGVGYFLMAAAEVAKLSK